MPLKYSAFISYPHTQGSLVKDFLTRFETELRNSTGPYLDYPLWYDKQRLEPSYNFDVAIAQDLCQAICMVVLVMPAYEKKLYCLREFMGMEQLEKQRLQLLGIAGKDRHTMIIPVVLRSDSTAANDPILPSWMGKRQPIDFRSYLGNPSALFDNPENKQQVEKIAKIINDLHALLIKLEKDPCVGCTEFTLPSDAEAAPRRVGSPWEERPTCPWREDQT